LELTSVYGETAALEAAGREALARLAAEGFDLPVLDLKVFASTEPCRSPNGLGRAGVTTISADGYEVRSCGTMATILHELAHVWEHHNLDDAARRGFLDLRGLDSWSHEDWDRAGGEHLAWVVAWGLTGERPPMIRPIDDASLAVAYELATGAQPPTLVARGLVVADGRLRRISVDQPSASGSVRDFPRGPRIPAL
jgi:hypothetical protein